MWRIASSICLLDPDNALPAIELIVRVRVEGITRTRAVVKPLPADGATGGRPTVDVIPFTETTVRVLEVFKGNVGDRIIVSQTGGQLAATNQYPGVNVQLGDDPLYAAGTGHLLFLVPAGEQIYITVNPAGRYEIRGSAVLSPAEPSAAYKQPATLAELIKEINASLGG